MTLARLSFAAALAAVVTAAPAAFAQTSWTADPAVAGDFADAANWSAGAPGFGSTALIDNGGTAQISALYSPLVALVDVASTDGSTGTLNVVSGGEIFSDRIRIGNQGVGTATVTDGLLIAGGDSLFVGSSEQNGTAGDAMGTLTLNAGGVATSDDDLQLGSEGTGVLNMATGSTASGVFTVVGKFGTGEWNQTGGVYNHRGGDFEIGDGGRPNQIDIPGPREGTMNISGGAIRVWNRFAIGNSIGTGTVNISGGALAITGDGATEIGDGRENDLVIGRGADWSPADVTANGITDNDVTFRVTGDEAIIAVGSDLLMDPNDVFASSNLIAEITGPTHSPILVGRNAQIQNGNFLVELNDYTPVSGDSWSIIQTNVDLTDALVEFDTLAAAEAPQDENGDPVLYDDLGFPMTLEEAFIHNNNSITENPTDPSFVGVNGPFLSVDFSSAPLPEGLSFELEYFENEVLLSVVGSQTTLGADFNGDGVVNLVDLNILGANFGMPVPVANGDADGDGDSDLVDLNILGSEFTTGAAAVPEPASCLIAFAGIAMAAARRRQG